MFMDAHGRQLIDVRENPSRSFVGVKILFVIRQQTTEKVSVAILFRGWGFDIDYVRISIRIWGISLR